MGGGEGVGSMRTIPGVLLKSSTSRARSCAARNTPAAKRWTSAEITSARSRNFLALAFRSAGPKRNGGGDAYADVMAWAPSRRMRANQKGLPRGAGLRGAESGAAEH